MKNSIETSTANNVPVPAKSQSSSFTGACIFAVSMSGELLHGYTRGVAIELCDSLYINVL
jgi:hypothetical protein